MGFVLKSARFLHLHSPRPGNRFPSELEWSRRLEAPALALCRTFSDVLRTHLYSTKISRSPIKPHAAPPVPVGDVRWRSGGRLPRRPWHCGCLGLLRSAKSFGSRPARGVCTLTAPAAQFFSLLSEERGRSVLALLPGSGRSRSAWGGFRSWGVCVGFPR